MQDEVAKQNTVTRSGRSVVVGIVVASVLAAAAVVVFRSAGGADPVAARVPDTVSSYLQASLNPSVEQKRFAEGLARRLPKGEADLERLIDDAFARAVGGAGVDDPAGVEAWRGDEIAIATWSAEPEHGGVGPTYLLVQVADQGRAASWVAEQGERAVLESGFVVFSEDGDVPGFVDRAADRSLFRDRAFRSARDRVGGDGILLARVDLGSLAGLGSVATALPVGVADTEGSLVFGVSLVEGGIELTVTEDQGFLEGPLPAPDDLALLAELAEHADIAVGINDVAALMRQALTQAEEDAAALESRYGLNLEEDLLSWLGGETAFRVGFVGGEPHANIVVESSDEEAMRSFIATAHALAAVAGGQSGIEIRGDDPEDFTVLTDDVRVRVTIEGSRLNVDVVPVGSRGAIDDRPALSPPSGLASLAGMLSPTALSMIGDELPADVPPIEQVSFVGIADDEGARLSLRITFKEAA